MLIYEPKRYPYIPFKKGDVVVDYYTKNHIGQINHVERWLFIRVDTELFYNPLWRTNGFRYLPLTIRFYSSTPAIAFKQEFVSEWQIHNAGRITIK